MIPSIHKKKGKNKTKQKKKKKKLLHTFGWPFQFLCHLLNFNLQNISVLFICFGTYIGFLSVRVKNIFITVV